LDTKHSAQAVSCQFCQQQKKKSNVAKGKFVTNVNKNCLKRGCALRCSKVAKVDFGPVGALQTYEIMRT
jgi:hypothetical protein